MNYGFKMVWEEDVVATLKVLYRRLPGGTKKNDGKPQLGYPVSDRDAAQTPPEYKSQEPSLEPAWSLRWTKNLHVSHLFNKSLLNVCNCV
jgi:hypothetical protein